METENNKKTTTKKTVDLDKDLLSFEDNEQELASCQEQLNASHELTDFYKGIFNAIPTPVMAIDKEYNIVYMNDSGAKVAQISSENLIGKKCFNVMNTSHCNTSECRLRQAMERHSNFTGETTANTASGKIPIRYTGAPLKNEKGEVIGAVEYVLDISEEIEITDGIEILAENIDEGKLNFVIDEDKYVGNYKKIVTAVNTTVANFIKPINVTSQYINDISVGNMPPKITDEYKGDFNIIKNNLNGLIDAINAIIKNSEIIADGDVNVVLKKRSENDALMISLNKLIDAFKEIQKISKEIAGGDLTVDVKIRSDKDEIFKAYAEMVKKLNEVVGSVYNVADGLSSAGKDISSNSQSLSQGASEQASSVEEISSSMEEMVSNIEQNTENAQETEKIAVKAADDILEGSNNVNQTVEAMKQIADKVSIINDIAFQTNILALNAAIEAARAGEHGRGFAVVAAEVRKLAEKTQVAAGEINEMTKTSVEVAQKSGILLRDLVPDIQRNAKLVQEITAASLEQRRGAEQINKAINQLNDVAQQNASSSEEMATASEELNSQSYQLLDMVSFFKLLEYQGKSSNMNRNSGAKTTKNIRQYTNKNTGIELNLGKGFNDDDEYEKF
ncbi:MAG: PAS domain-containing protein [Bacteroidales bacterium]|nr:PAS domain-containing protein [Bacteroidales bacterium]